MTFVSPAHRRPSSIALRAMAAGCALSVVCAVAPASAQPQPPQTGTAGTGARVPQRRVVTNPLSVDPNGPSKLVLSIGAFTSYDNNRLGSFTSTSTSTTTTGTGTTADPLTETTTTTTTTTPYFWRTGIVAGGNLGLDYNQAWSIGQRASIAATGFSNVNVFSRRQRPLLGAGLGFSETFPLGARMTVSASQALRFQPFFGFNVFPGLNNIIGTIDTSDAIDPTLMNAVSPMQMYNLALNSNASYQVSRRGSINFGYARNDNYFVGSTLPRFEDYMVNGGYSHQISRFLSARIGYGYGRNNFGQAAGSLAPTRHNIDIGLDSGLGRAFALTRGLSFGFRTGMGLISTAQSQFQPNLRYQLQITGNAFLRQNLGRSWSASMVYRRGWSAITGFGTPFFMDGVTANIGGALSRRVSAGLTASYVKGSVGVLGANDSTAFNGNATLRYFPTSWLVAYGQFVHYRLALPDGVSLPVDFPSQLRRSSARVGLSIQVPLF